jgi:hypothetical protein
MRNMAYWGFGAIFCAGIAWGGCGEDTSFETGATTGAGATGATGANGGAGGTGGGTSNGGTGGMTGPGGGGSSAGGNGNCPQDPAPPGEVACPAECSTCTNDNTCVIECGPGDCADGTIDCPPDWACAIHCSGVDACDTSVVNCPPDYACSIVCEGGNDACGDVQLNCGSASCDVQCGDDNCNGMTVACGAGACTTDCMANPPPQLDCGSSCDCTPCP